MTNEHLRLAIVIMNMQNNIRPISYQARHEFLMTTPFARFLLLQLYISVVYMEPTWTCMNWTNKKVIFQM